MVESNSVAYVTLLHCCHYKELNKTAFNINRDVPSKKNIELSATIKKKFNCTINKVLYGRAIIIMTGCRHL